MFNQYLTDILTDTYITIPYLTDPLLCETDTNRFFKPNQYLPIFNHLPIFSLCIVKATFNWS